MSETEVTSQCVYDVTYSWSGGIHKVFSVYLHLLPVAMVCKPRARAKV